MSDYDFILDNARFSYSSISTFNTCPYSYKLNYIDLKNPKESNFFGEYGLLVHECLEKFFNGSLEFYELSQYYSEKYNEAVKTPSPPCVVDLDERYRNQGQFFFDNFSFDREGEEIVLVEDRIDFDLDDVKVVAKPDLVLKNKDTGITTLYDYKTALPYRDDKRSGKEITDTKKIEGYYKQMYIYTYALRTAKGIPIDKIDIWFTRGNREISIPWDLEKETEAIEWFKESIRNIRNEKIFPFNNSSKYFCDNLCGVRNFCEYR